MAETLNGPIVRCIKTGSSSVALYRRKLYPLCRRTAFRGIRFDPGKIAAPPFQIMAYYPPKSILEVLQKIEYEEALPAGDPRYVDTQEARGSEQTFSVLARKFVWDPATGAFLPPNDKHVLFFGHIGSGKTTELRRYMRRFDQSKRFYVVEVDVLAKLDRNNLQYSEVLMAMAESVLERLVGDGYTLADDAIDPIRDWFTSAVTTRGVSREVSAESRRALRPAAVFRD